MGGGGLCGRAPRDSPALRSELPEGDAPAPAPSRSAPPTQPFRARRRQDALRRELDSVFPGPTEGVRRTERGRRQPTAGGLLGSSGRRTRVPGPGKGEAALAGSSPVPRPKMSLPLRSSPARSSPPRGGPMLGRPISETAEGE